MVGMVEYATHDDAGLDGIAGEFAQEMALGLVAGVAGGFALLWLLRRIALPDVPLYPLLVLGFAAGVIYGLAAIVGGSGFLAVFVAGILIGDAAAPHKGEVERFHNALADLAEMAVFIALGLTVDLTFIVDEGLWLDGLLLALLLAVVTRPLVIGGLLLPTRLSWRERIFVMWSGLKGAVPILLASLAVTPEGRSTRARSTASCSWSCSRRWSSRGRVCRSSLMPCGCPCAASTGRRWNAGVSSSRPRRSPADARSPSFPSPSAPGSARSSATAGGSTSREERSSSPETRSTSSATSRASPPCAASSRDVIAGEPRVPPRTPPSPRAVTTGGWGSRRAKPGSAREASRFDRAEGSAQRVCPGLVLQYA